MRLCKEAASMAKGESNIATSLNGRGGSSKKGNDFSNIIVVWSQKSR